MPLESFNLHRIDENDFDQVVEKAGGERIDDSIVPDGVKSADYELGGAVIELKIVEEEGLEKPERQEKIGALFRDQFPDFPVVVVDPYIIDETSRRKLFRILEGPIKGLVKKASKQLATSGAALEATARVLIIFNNGFMSLRHKDFEKLVLKCVRNDTQNIDLVIVGGMYFHYDGFDNYMNFYFTHHPINANVNPDLKSLDASWNDFVTGYMNDVVMNPSEESPGKRPSSDISFDKGGVTFVRPRPQVGKQSTFFIHGRPRENSTGKDRCPPVASVIPDIAPDQWKTLRELLTDGANLPESATEWCEREAASDSQDDPLRPNVTFRFSIDGFLDSIDKGTAQPTVEGLKYFACEIMSDRCRHLASQASDLPEVIALANRYILVHTTEIGSDKAYDFSSILLISDIPGFESEEILVKNQRIFFEHALCLGASYAVKHSCSAIYTRKNTDFGWV